MRDAKVAGHSVSLPTGPTRAPGPARSAPPLRRGRDSGTRQAALRHSVTLSNIRPRRRGAPAGAPIVQTRLSVCATHEGTGLNRRS